MWQWGEEKKWKLRQILFWARSQSQIIYQVWLHLFSTFPPSQKRDCVYFLLYVQLRRVIFLKSAVARETHTLTSAANQRSIVHFSKSFYWSISAAFIQQSLLQQSIDWWCQISQNGDGTQGCILELVDIWLEKRVSLKYLNDTNQLNLTQQNVS